MNAKTLVEIFKEREAKNEQGSWIPGCGGMEIPFHTRSGRKLLYCWQPSSGKHAYLDVGTDLILTDEEAREVIGI